MIPVAPGEQRQLLPFDRLRARNATHDQLASTSSDQPQSRPVSPLRLYAAALGGQPATMITDGGEHRPLPVEVWTGTSATPTGPCSAAVPAPRSISAVGRDA